MFDANIIPLHTTGLSLQGQNLGDLRFGYDLMVGNGLGSSDIEDNDKNKSVTAAIHFKPVEGLRIGTSYYSDVISKGSMVHGYTETEKFQVNQHLYTGSVAYFGKKYELLAESTLASNHTDTTGTKHTLASYIYAGVRIKDKIGPYAKVERINYQKGEVYYHKDNTTSFIGGIRYEISYLAVLKLEYEYDKREITGTTNKITAQFAIGF